MSNNSKNLKYEVVIFRRYQGDRKAASKTQKNLSNQRGLSPSFVERVNPIERIDHIVFYGLAALFPEMFSKMVL